MIKIVQWLNFLFAQYPLLYRKILYKQKTPNFEKLLFLSVLRRGDVVVDIGANRGYYTILFSHVVGHLGKIHAFEPVPVTFSYLTQNLVGQKIFSNVVLNNCALGDQIGEAILYLPDEDDGQASMRQSHKIGSWQTVRQVQSYPCRLQTLDHYCQGWPRLDFIKCDVEGAELLVLQGSQKTIHQYHPMIYLEVFSAWTKAFDYRPFDLLQHLMNLGYQEFYLCTGQFVQLLTDPEDYFQEPPEESVNLLCTIPKHHGDRTTRLTPICTKTL